MKFRTEYKAVKSGLRLDPRKPVVLLGSCFSQNIAGKMSEHEWDAITPAGTLYNPLSIGKSIELLKDRDNGLQLFEKSLFQSGGIWNSRWFDSSFSSLEKEDCVEEFRRRRDEFVKTLDEGKTLIITFGTSICYYMEKDGDPVGNCHKQPSSLFYRARLSVEDIVGRWNDLLAMLRKEISGLRVIFTVSPVRHLKDGFEGNAGSKAVLLLALEEICRVNPDCVYFPAYEIVNDDLRDYRFYAEDLVHPSDEAVGYIWEKFIETFVDSEDLNILAEGSRRYKARMHRSKTGALGKTLS